MARSTIERLPRDLRDLCLRLIREGSTIHQITDKLNELDADVSKSAVGRYVKSAREQMARYREAQEIAGQWVTQLNERPNGDVGALLPEMLKLIALETMNRISDEQVANPDSKTKPMDVMLLAKAFRDLEATTKGSLERREKIERMVIEKAADKAGEVGKRAGLSQAVIDQIQQELRLL
ncbi:MAG TPA: DUF3486 family protein [Xanthomonadaceae bacterium]|nr:DUF3486 family protein [Xanthomonadaceae bacterium]